MRPSETLHSHRDTIRQVVAQHHACNPRVFGSVIHGLDTEESDLDLLVDPSASTTLFTLARLGHEAEALLKVRVSVLTPGFLSMKFRDLVLEQAQPL